MAHTPGATDCKRRTLLPEPSEINELCAACGACAELARSLQNKEQAIPPATLVLRGFP